jgi:branched-subunit amino acid aminotransferase/4-amino-4-deoxychorismate lyase
LKTIVTINGKVVAGKRATVSVFDNALLYAEGLFETFLVVDRHILFSDIHLDRLFRGAQAIALNIPVSRQKLERWLTNAARMHPDRIMKLRLTVTAGESARWVGRQGKPQIIIIASPHEMPMHPFSLWVSPIRVDENSEFRQIKTLSYVIQAAALRQAKERGCHDALLLNQRGHVAEVSSANIFWVTHGKIYTPSLSAGCLEGVTRRIVLQQAKALGYDVTEKNITLRGLLKANEVFISSSLKLVVAVNKLRIGKQTHSLPVGSITGEIAERFYRLAGIWD